MPTRPRSHRPRPLLQKAPDNRASSSARGYDRRWQHARLAFLRAFPLCAECERKGSVAAAAVVDHVIPHRGDVELFWDVGNWQPLCKLCHDRKTGRGG